METKCRQIKRNFALIVLLTALLCLTSAVHASAARKSQWYTASDGYTYYYNAKGKKVTGLRTIKKKKYFFDAKGRQRTGWRKIGKNYYYFAIASGKKGCMKVSTTVNNITLRSDGRAKLTSYSKSKLQLLCIAAQKVDQITTPKMSKKQKLRACFNLLRDGYIDTQMGSFRRSSVWDINYARIGLITNAVNRRADCYVSACTFGYLANAVGYKVTLISTGKHGWVEINGKVYDPAFARALKIDTFFGMNYNMSGVNGRPRFKQSRYLKATLETPV